MSKTIEMLLLIILITAAVLAFPCYAQKMVSSLELLNKAKEYDGKTVTYQGETVGDIMVRKDHCWLHLNDGYIALAIWAGKDKLKDISWLGSYRAQGDIIEVTGIFHRSCPEHGGDLDIHALAVKKVLSGKPAPLPSSRRKLLLSLAMSFIAGGFYLAGRMPRRH